MLKSCPNEDRATLLPLNERGQYTVRQAIGHYLKTDIMREGKDDWRHSEPTGVFFEGFHLFWRDCFLLAKLACELDTGLETTVPPQSMDEANFEFSEY